jgi:hypothetical protein
VGTSDEDESLGNDSDLEIGNHVELRIIVSDGRWARELNTELVLEE